MRSIIWMPQTKGAWAMKRYAWMLWAFIILSVVCSASAWAGKTDDTLVWATDREIRIADPYFQSLNELDIIAHMTLDGLLYWDCETNKVEPLLAKRWNWINATTVEFELRDDVVFHDGSPFDADDVVYTINFLANNADKVAKRIHVEWLKGAEKIGTHEVRVNLAKPFPAADLYFALSIFILPEGHYEKAPLTKKGKKDFGAVKPIGTGPYEITEVIPNERIVMKKNKSYFQGGPKGLPQIGTVVFRTIKKEQQIEDLLAGSVDWIWDVPKEQAERLSKQPSVTIATAKTPRLSYLQFDVIGRSGTKFFTDRKVREAFAHAIKRGDIVKNLMAPGAEVAHAACTPTQFGCAQDLPRWEYDPKKAKQLFAAAGYPDGFQFDLYAYRERQYTEAVIKDLAEVGVKANLKFLPYQDLKKLVAKGATPVNHMTWGANAIPDVSATTGHFFSGGPDDMAKDEKVRKWLSIANTSTDPAVRKKYYRRALKRIQREVYWLPMFTYAKYYAFTKDLDFHPTPDEIPRFYNTKWK
jgi:peptide/nickel transport system substrate-binding protein